MRNWGRWPTVEAGKRLQVEWFDLDDVQSPADDLRLRGFDQGAARFARGEGMWYASGEVYFACTRGGRERKGQIWKYMPWPAPDGRQAGHSGTLELFVEPNDTRVLESADNLTAAPWGDIIICEDREDAQVRILGITPYAEAYTFANGHQRTGFSGVTFSPDGSTLFVNIQEHGLTLAITGPW
jgi:secreted PhoX family phosphatase